MLISMGIKVYPFFKNPILLESEVDKIMEKGSRQHSAKK